MTCQPEPYDVVTPPSLQGDVEWYCRKAADGGGPVLELGAGTGRVTVPIAEAGVEIYALDASDAMLQILERKLAAAAPEVRSRVHLVTADMRTFDLTDAHLVEAGRSRQPMNTM